MAYQNFIPTVWAEGMMRDLERKCVFAKHCTREYDGDVKKAGDRVRILGVGNPTIYTIDRAQAGDDIEPPENIEETAITLDINQIAYYNFFVGDIDEVQAKPNVMEKLRGKATARIAAAMDTYIAGFAADKNLIKLSAAAKKLVVGNAGEGEINVLHALENAQQILFENDVSTNETIVATVSPRFFTLFRREYMSRDTSNSTMMENGVAEKYGNIIIEMSNNVLRTGALGAQDNILMRSEHALAFVNSFTTVQPYEPEKKFGDAIKGMVLYDACVVSPKEAVVLNLTY